MKRTTKYLIAVAVLVVSIVGVAAAASSPTVSTGPATGITTTSVTLTATVNPNGADTGVGFQYGPTASYGLSTVSRTIGAGTKPVTVKITVTHLTPGTIYHYKVGALNKAGATTGGDRQFTTAGPPPASVATGPPVDINHSRATVTGSVNPEGANTTYVVQYGLADTYGLETEPAIPLAKVATSLPVALTLQGLAPATLFHYRIVAYHGSVESDGADATFFTEPIRPPTPRLSARTTPGTDSKKPYVFTTNGSLTGANFIPASSRCAGSVDLGYYVGSKRIGVVAAPVGSDCKFTAQESFRHVPGAIPAHLLIKIKFNGNGYIAAVSRTSTVTAG